ncbi:tellurite resistance/C4-dicarboxylate transporter family protein [Streptomyces sp. NBC_00233]|uniref:tellurite resistance/C4-dicarboxylate transporter family protein n=1 Tax=Streptomyces sp. NBC_00233 TaxID=2975686 RepID=UPI002251CECE|nr:tellurite resistance/C4-dicarboxylate transporter family protein [Streptomyces sp. NBC_00233]MCX5232362.1 tellurite resistance/C4-dicarboxylate transporter family protein [Streptomyces sp. NBC_00233]
MHEREHAMNRYAGHWAAWPPVAGAAVMATGILSVGLSLTGFEVVSVVALWLATALWLLLALGFSALLVKDRRRWEVTADTPPALTAVAATTVLGVRFDLLGLTPVAVSLLVIAAVMWPAMLIAVLRHLTRRAPGAVFLICVATQGLAILCAVLAPEAGDWLARVALGLFLLGLVLYVDALARFEFRQVVAGAGDQWIAGGALAISALAGSKLLASGVWSGGAATTLRTTTLVLTALDLAWYAVLICGEFTRPRLGYDVRRWATVFPLGMTAVASLSVAAATGVAWLETLGRVLLWIAVAVWLPTAYGFTRSLMGRAADRSSPAAADRRPARTRRWR